MQVRQNGEGNDNEEVGHFPDGNSVCSVADDSENGKKAQCKSEVNFNGHQQIAQQVDRTGDEDEGKDVVTTLRDDVVNPQNEDQARHQVPRKRDKQVQHILHGFNSGFPSDAGFVSLPIDTFEEAG